MRIFPENGAYKLSSFFRLFSFAYLVCFGLFVCENTLNKHFVEKTRQNQDDILTDHSKHQYGETIRDDDDEKSN